MSYLVYVKQAIGNLFKPPVTSKYPLAPKEFCAGCRGHVVNDISKCVLCGMCERSCPAGAITVDRKTGEWKIDPFACVQCGACVAACPKKCLAMDPHYAEPAREKTEVLLTAAVPGASRPARPEAAAKTVHPVMPKEEHSRVVNNVMRCVFCGVCERNCPSNAIKVDRRNRTWRINLEACVNCGTCIDNCPRKCLALGCYIGKKTEITVRGAMPQRPHVPRPAAKPAAAETKPEEIKTAAPIAEEIKAAPVIEEPKPAAPEVKPAPIAEAAKPIEAAKPAPAEAVRPAPAATPAPAPAPAVDTADVPDMHIRNFIEKCLFCGKCTHVCPAEAITIDRRARTWTIDREKCITCGACEGDCPAHCLTLADSWEEGETKAMQTTYQGKVPARRPPVRPATPKPAAPAPAVSEEKEKAAENAPDA